MWYSSIPGCWASPTRIPSKRQRVERVRRLLRRSARRRHTDPIEVSPRNALWVAADGCEWQQGGSDGPTPSPVPRPVTNDVLLPASDECVRRKGRQFDLVPSPTPHSVTKGTKRLLSVHRYTRAVEALEEPARHGGGPLPAECSYVARHGGGPVPAACSCSAIVDFVVVVVFLVTGSPQGPAPAWSAYVVVVLLVTGSPLGPAPAWSAYVVVVLVVTGSPLGPAPACA